MMTLAVPIFVDLFVFIFNILIITRAIMSFVVAPESRFFQGLVGITEPVLAPVRRMMPPTSGIDLAPLVTLFLLEALQYGVQWLWPVSF